MSAPLSEADKLHRRRRRQVIAFITFPAVLIATAGVGSAAGNGWLRGYSKPVCSPMVVAAPARSSFSLNVLNSSGIPGAASPVYQELGKRGFRMATLGNDTVLRATAPQGEIRYGSKGLDQALLIQQQVPGAKMMRIPDRTDSAVDVVVGTAFPGLAPRPPRPPARPEQVLVNVYNTTYYENLATNTSNELVARGFRRGAISADPQKSWVREIAVIRHGENGDLNAKLLQQQVPGSTLQLDGRKDGSLDLLLGMQWKGLIARDKIPPIPPPPPVVKPTVARPCPAS
ncbi:LytR C-terminal domain-containing protein [Arsenicicoccus dermatophilus]|uniref:LytR C-terminal domain-containing protein n=1 Tax=Arsenicicoccus dermatophilus TaxID=1076331 RepID=UPI001F4CB5FF|nr:LytR C-terminal domain-containing protein [Arsenicicoccus dermatophilus]MCH8611732.1 LytR C-terminal domain-containing protein [Arsenicicoccus dermatophilus]